MLQLLLPPSWRRHWHQRRLLLSCMQCWRLRLLLRKWKQHWSLLVLVLAVTPAHPLTWRQRLQQQLLRPGRASCSCWQQGSNCGGRRRA